MSVLSLIGASKDFGIKSLFHDLTLHIEKNERLGLIGPNGAGKSTLLKVISGLEPLNLGERRCNKKTLIKHVTQETSFHKGRTVLEEVLAGCGQKKELLINFRKSSEEVAQKPNEKSSLEKLGQLSQEMDHAEAWNLESQCQEILSRLGIQNLHQPVDELSGGFQKRVGLASALLSNPDLLLLDEPTNHLDAIAVEWLQNWLKNFKGALVLVTHDRYVLDCISTRMVEVDQGIARIYHGNYNNYLKEKSKVNSIDKSKEHKLKSILRRELAWLSQGPKARSTKQKARTDRIEILRNKSISSNQKQLRIENLKRRIGKVVIEAECLKVRQDKYQDSKILIEDFNYNFSPNDRVGIIGKNGSGKSTLLELIAGLRKPDSGQLRIGETIHIGYLDQHTKEIKNPKDLKTTVIQFVEEKALFIELQKKKISASQLLERFLFSPAQQHLPIAKLSGGERRRLTLCRLLVQAPNVLLLDEPTNDLDVYTLSILEDFLEDFFGCVIIVSHDRYFLDRTVNRIFCFENNKLNRYEGNYTDFLNKSREKIICETEKSSQKNTSKLSKEKNITHRGEVNKFQTHKPRRRSFKESKELEILEKQLPEFEKRRNFIEKSMSENNADLSQLSNQLAEVVLELAKAEERWLELSELAP
ncbi:ABC-F family ATP-binding cassette domain-containing protein [Prochlorococcus sp. MIT 1300]|uniref:ABC-F family ATP-binding cassette domain-containing protein n=1 Tax=Prochlorococcus sp. MIT 1300 TaxID=3096218 RepID=UPI002A765115|nr:ABC-F family ATP-binding cassette domain-containing protein [Prochlorococcus sp. MIT 1300]